MTTDRSNAVNRHAQFIGAGKLLEPREEGRRAVSAECKLAWETSTPTLLGILHESCRPRDQKRDAINVLHFEIDGIGASLSSLISLLIVRTSL
jgi:hypothetical protein